MSLLRRRGLERSGASATRTIPYGPGWDVPEHFNYGADVVDVLARERLRQAATFVGHDGTIERLTFGEVLGLGLRWSRVLDTRLQRGDRVLVALEPSSAWVGAILGSLRIGIIPVVAGATLSDDALALRLVQTQPALVVTDEHTADRALAAQGAIESSVPVITPDELALELLQAGAYGEPVSSRASDPALIVYSGGRGGMERPIVHTHAAAFAAFVPARDWLDARQGDLVCCGTGGAAALTLWSTLFGPWELGATVAAVDPRLDPDEALAALERLEPTVLVDTPVGHAARLDALAAAGGRLHALRHAVSSGAPLDASVAERHLAETGVRLRNGLTTTELGTFVFQTPKSEAGAEAIGLAAPGHIVAVLDEAGAEVLQDGSVGQLAVYGRPPSLSPGVWGAPPFTDQHAWWTATGDLARLRDDGEFELVPDDAADATVVDEDEPAATTGIDELATRRVAS